MARAVRRTTLYNPQGTTMKIAIIGAGPAGATAAMLLARKRRHEITLLDRDHFPRVKTCGSGLSPRCLKLFQEIGLSQRMAALAYCINGCRFVAPNGREAVLKGKQSAWIIPRATFDAEIAFQAERDGARFVQGFKATRLLRDPDGRVRGLGDGKTEIEADLVLCADGAHARFAIDTRPKQQIATIMGWWEGVPYTDGCLEMFFDHRVSPWYGWLFPETAARVNIGICYDPADPADPKEIFREVVERNVGARLRGAQQVGKLRGAPISYTRTIGPVATPGALFIGESARLTNAATGEGIYYAMRSAQVAAEAVARHDRLGPDLYDDYTETTRRTFTARLTAAVAFMRFVATPAFNWLASLATAPAVQRHATWLLANV